MDNNKLETISNLFEDSVISSVLDSEKDTLDTKWILRLIESLPRTKAEPFKLWLAKMGDMQLKLQGKM